MMRIVICLIALCGCASKRTGMIAGGSVMGGGIAVTAAGGVGYWAGSVPGPNNDSPLQPATVGMMVVGGALVVAGLITMLTSGPSSRSGSVESDEPNEPRTPP